MWTSISYIVTKLCFLPQTFFCDKMDSVYNYYMESCGLLSHNLLLCCSVKCSDTTCEIFSRVNATAIYLPYMGVMLDQGNQRLHTIAGSWNCYTVKMCIPSRKAFTLHDPLCHTSDVQFQMHIPYLKNLQFSSDTPTSWLSKANIIAYSVCPLFCGNLIHSTRSIFSTTHTGPIFSNLPPSCHSYNIDCGYTKWCNQLIL